MIIMAHGMEPLVVQGGPLVSSANEMDSIASNLSAITCQLDV